MATEMGVLAQGLVDPGGVWGNSPRRTKPGGLNLLQSGAYFFRLHFSPRSAILTTTHRACSPCVAVSQTTEGSVCRRGPCLIWPFPRFRNFQKQLDAGNGV